MSPDDADKDLFPPNLSLSLTSFFGFAAGSVDKREAAGEAGREGDAEVGCCVWEGCRGVAEGFAAMLDVGETAL